MTGGRVSKRGRDANLVGRALEFFNQSFLIVSKRLDNIASTSPRCIFNSLASVQNMLKRRVLPHFPMQTPVGLDAVVFFFQNLDVTKATSASLISTFALARSPGSYDAVRVRAFPGRASWRDLSVRCW